LAVVRSSGEESERGADEKKPKKKNQERNLQNSGKKINSVKSKIKHRTHKAEHSHLGSWNLGRV